MSINPAAKARQAAHNLKSKLNTTKEAILQLDMQEVAGPYVLTDNAIWAHYELSPQRWSFLGDETRGRTLDLNAARWASLAGHAIRLRVTTRPYAAYDWAAQLDRRITPLPDLPESVDYEEWLARREKGEHDIPLSYAGWLESQQRRVQRSTLDQKMVVLSVRVADRPKGLHGAELLEALADIDYDRRSKPVVNVVRQIHQMDEKVAREGFDGMPLTSTDMEWFIYRSMAVGVTVPEPNSISETWAQDDLASFTDSVRWHYEPFARTVEVEAWRNNQMETRHVCVLTSARMGELTYPESGKQPWATIADGMPFPVEWSISGTIESGRGLEAAADYQRNRALNIAAHYAEHGERPPLATRRAIEHAEQVVDEVSEGEIEVAARFSGVVRIAVAGLTPDEAISRAEDIQDRYNDRLRPLTWEIPAFQSQKLREFIPGEPWEKQGYQRVMPVRYLAAALPNVTGAIGDGIGPYFGVSCTTSRTALMMDSNYLIEQKGESRPGVCPIIAEPGKGKSTLTGAIAYAEVRTGVQTVIFDPSGPLSRLTQVPELRPFSHHVSLFNGDPGSLNPCALMPHPSIEGLNEREYKREKKRVNQLRKDVLIDTLRAVVRPSIRLIANEVLFDAVGSIAVTPETSPWEVVEVLERSGNVQAKRFAKALREAADSLEGSLIFGEPGMTTKPFDPDTPLTVITLERENLSMPPEGADEELLSPSDLILRPLLNLGVMFASRFAYAGSPNSRKALHLDEVQFLGSWGSGRAFIQKLASDSRKRNLAVYLSTQLPRWIDQFGINSLFGHSFIGGLSDEITAREALSFLGVQEHYVRAVIDLQQGQFLYRDLERRVEKVLIDMYLPHLLEALDTDPNGTKTLSYGNRAVGVAG